MAVKNENKNELKVVAKARKELKDVLELLQTKKDIFSQYPHFVSIVEISQVIIEASDESNINQQSKESLVHQANAIIEQTQVIKELYKEAWNEKKG
jgi:hypothetical protein